MSESKYESLAAEGKQCLQWKAFFRGVWAGACLKVGGGHGGGRSEGAGAGGIAGSQELMEAERNGLSKGEARVRGRPGRELIPAPPGERVIRSRRADGRLEESS